MLIESIPFGILHPLMQSARILSLKCVFLTCSLLWVGVACSPRPPKDGLPSLKDTVPVRGKTWYRIQTHLHGPYSYDSCDDHGLNPDGTVNRECEQALKEGLCANHIDLAFLTDHVHNLASAKYSDLLLREPGESAILNARGREIGTEIPCPDQTKTRILPGVETETLTLGIEDLPARTKGRPDLIGYPHTESKTIEEMLAFKPDFIEIFNLHALVHPLIRKNDLHVNRFGPMLSILKYLYDPFHFFDPDFLLLDFLELNPVYFEKWAALLTRNIRATALGGIDSHQNLLKQIGPDGYRIDAHRRMLRFLSNFVLSEGIDPQSVKRAIREGRVQVVFEVLGTPEHFDFHARSTLDPTHPRVAEMGGGIGSALKPELSVEVPRLRGDSAKLDPTRNPDIFTDLIRLDPNGNETTVVRHQTSDFTYPHPDPGYYRVQTWIQPRHLHGIRPWGGPVDQPYIWLVSNPIRIE